MMKYTFSFFRLISSFRQVEKVSTPDILYVSPGVLRKCIFLITCIAVGSARYTQTDVNFRTQGNRLPNNFFRDPREIARDQRDTCTYACTYVCAPMVYVPEGKQEAVPCRTCLPLLRTAICPRQCGANICSGQGRKSGSGGTNGDTISVIR